MLNISKSPAVIFGCSALVAASLGSFVRTASAAEQFDYNGRPGTLLIAQNTTSTNSSNATGTNVTTTTGGSIPQQSGPTGVSPATIARINAFNQNLPVLESNVIQTRAEVTRLESIVTTAPDTSPVRYAIEKGVADLASCGCPDATAIGSTPTTPRPELIAAREAEAKAAAELAAAKAEARQFIESVKSGREATARTVDTSLW